MRPGQRRLLALQVGGAREQQHRGQQERHAERDRVLEDVHELRREQLHVAGRVVVLRETARVPAVHAGEQQEREPRAEEQRDRRDRRRSFGVLVAGDRRGGPAHQDHQEDAHEIDRQVARQVEAAREHPGEDVEAVVVARLLVRRRRVVERVHAAAELLDHRLVAVHRVLVVHLVAERQVPVDHDEPDGHREDPALRALRGPRERIGRELPREDEQRDPHERRRAEAGVEAREQTPDRRGHAEEHPERDRRGQRAGREGREPPGGGAAAHEAARRDPDADEGEYGTRPGQEGRHQETASTFIGTVAVPRHEFWLCQPIVTFVSSSDSNQPRNSLSLM